MLKKWVVFTVLVIVAVSTIAAYFHKRGDRVNLQSESAPLIDAAPNVPSKVGPKGI